MNTSLNQIFWLSDQPSIKLEKKSSNQGRDSKENGRQIFVCGYDYRDRQWLEWNLYGWKGIFSGGVMARISHGVVCIAVLWSWFLYCLIDANKNTSNFYQQHILFVIKFSKGTANSATGQSCKGCKKQYIHNIYTNDWLIDWLM